MTCKQNTDEESYDFFDNIQRYIKDGKSIEFTGTSYESIEQCTSFSEQWGNISGNKKLAKDICDRLISLYKILSNRIQSYKDYTYYKSDFRFLNYWVNLKIRKGHFNGGTCVDEFYTHIGNHFFFVTDYVLDDDLIYDIKNDDLYNMNILFNLYENYSKLKIIIDTKLGAKKQSLLPHSNECCTNYIEAKYICNGGNNNESKFCEKLEKFKTKYNELYETFYGKRSEFSDSLIKLEECPNTKIITTAVTGTVVGLIPLLGVLYKFTPMGQMFRSNKGILNNDISNNDEEIIKMSLMEQENEPLRFKQGTYNIKYQSL